MTLLSRRPVRTRLALGTATAALSAACLAIPTLATPTLAAPTATEPVVARAPALTVTVLSSGLTIPWDLGFIDSTRYLLTERTGRLWVASSTGGPRKRVRANLGDVALASSGGLMGLAVDPAFAANRTFYTCQTHKGTPNDVRVIRWRLSADTSTATRVGAPLIQGIPFGIPHFGCRVVVGPDGKLWVSTGDSGSGPAPQAKANLAGKILRVNKNGTIPADNPWAKQAGPIRYVWNYGHRNPQGLAWRPGTTQMWNTEHGPDWDDELNLVVRGGNYGWDPVYPDGSPGYNQLVPMTDLVKFPAAIPAKWSSGIPTIATSGLTFVTGAAWGSYDGAALVAQLKGAGVIGFTLDAAGTVTATFEVPELNDTYGRLRTVRQGPDGALYVLTSNGGGLDVVLRVSPS